MFAYRQTGMTLLARLTHRTINVSSIGMRRVLGRFIAFGVRILWFLPTSTMS
nr:uncharacterized protein CTRU02_15291 [Colletotrichum truncatum]KAF6781196.1 hypothetical protein CTRU02_15291 [Colletotrichum truncatum]